MEEGKKWRVFLSYDFSYFSQTAPPLLFILHEKGREKQDEVNGRKRKERNIARSQKQKRNGPAGAALGSEGPSISLPCLTTFQSVVVFAGH